MFSLSRRQGHAVLAGIAAAGTYLAAAEIGSKRPVKMGGLFLLSSMAMAGMVGQVLNSKASTKAHVTEARLNNFLGNGGSLGGNLYVNGDHHTTGNSFTSNHTVSGQLFGSGGTVSVGDKFDMQTNSIIGMQTVSLNGASNLSVSNGGLGLNGNLSMNSNNVVNGGHADFSQIGPGGVRANLGGVPTNTELRDRVNYILNTLLTGCNVSY